MANPPPNTPPPRQAPEFGNHLPFFDFTRPPPPLGMPFPMPMPAWGVVYEEVQRRRAMMHFYGDDETHQFNQFPFNAQSQPQLFYGNTSDFLVSPSTYAGQNREPAQPAALAYNVPLPAIEAPLPRPLPLNRPLNVAPFNIPPPLFEPRVLRSRIVKVTEIKEDDKQGREQRGAAEATFNPIHEDSSASDNDVPCTEGKGKEKSAKQTAAKASKQPATKSAMKRPSTAATSHHLSEDSSASENELPCTKGKGKEKEKSAKQTVSKASKQPAPAAKSAMKRPSTAATSHQLSEDSSASENEVPCTKGKGKGKGVDKSSKQAAGKSTAADDLHEIICKALMSASDDDDKVNDQRKPKRKRLTKPKSAARKSLSLKKAMSEDSSDPDDPQPVQGAAKFPDVPDDANPVLLDNAKDLVDDEPYADLDIFADNPNDILQAEVHEVPHHDADILSNEQNDDVIIVTDSDDSLPDLDLTFPNVDANSDICSIGLEDINKWTEVARISPCGCSNACLEHAVPWVMEHQTCYHCGSNAINVDCIPFALRRFH